MKITCTIHYGTTDGDCEHADGTPVEVPCVEARCSRCGHTTESYGDSEASVKRCMVLMREGCPRGEHNFYVPDDEPSKPTWVPSEPPDDELW